MSATAPAARCCWPATATRPRPSSAGASCAGAPGRGGGGRRAPLGRGVGRLPAPAARRREPALAPALRLAVALPDDHAVEPRRVVDALVEACARAGGRLLPDTPGTDVAALPAERVVIAAGAWSGELGDVPVRPVKGQALLLRDPSGP